MMICNSRHSQGLAQGWLGLLWSGVISVILWGMANGWLVQAAWAEELPSAFVRTHLQPENPVVGQQVELQIEVFVDTWFKQAPQFPDLQITDAIALLPTSASVNLNEQLGNRTYAGQRRTYFLFPQLPGRYDIPAVSLQVVPAAPGQSEPPLLTLTTEPLNFMAQLPPELATASNSPIVATPKLQVTEAWQAGDQTDIEDGLVLQIGNTLERTVTLQAADTLAAFLPAIDPGDNSGLTTYPDPTQLTNRFERGQFQAIRRDRIVYSAEQPGHYTLPALSLSWWDTQDQVLRTEALPPLQVRVKPTLKQTIQKVLPLLLVLIGSFTATYFYRKPLQQKWQAYRRRQADSEPATYRRLYQACLANDLQPIWQTLQDWINSTTPTPNTVTIGDFLSRVDDAELTEQVTTLEQILYSPSKQVVSTSPELGLQLSASLKRARRLWLRQKKATTRQNKLSTILPPLNP
jgi:hypothetical protein